MLHQSYDALSLKLTSDAYRTNATAHFKIRESTEMMSGTFEEKV